MNITQKTVLLTGGGSGIGLEIAKLLAAKQNKVIIVGRNREKLEKAVLEMPNGELIQADISAEADVLRLVSTVKEHYPELSVLINNAGIGNLNPLEVPGKIYETAHTEMAINYLAPVRLVEQLLPLLQQQPEAAVVNVSSILAFVPSLAISTYSDSKAALHSYTRALRLALSSGTAIKVFELMPPLVDTELTTELGGKENGIPPQQVAQELLDGIESDRYEIHVASTADFRKLYLSDPEGALLALNAQ